MIIGYIKKNSSNNLNGHTISDLYPSLWNKSRSKMFPLISIVTVTYNAADTLEKTINSVICQKYKNIEYIIIDGDSKDGTVDIIKKYAKYIDMWSSEPDNGIYDAMNKGIEKANGDFIGFLNADDWYEADAIAKVVDVLQQRPTLEFIYGDINVYGEQFLYVHHGNVGNNYIGDAIPHPSCFIKSSILKQNNFDLKYHIAADYELVARLIKELNIKKAYCNITLANYRIGGVSSRFIKARLEVFRINLKYFGLFYSFKIALRDIAYKSVWITKKIARKMRI